jgi:ArsR family transcriptional regulator
MAQFFRNSIQSRRSVRKVTQKCGNHALAKDINKCLYVDMSLISDDLIDKLRAAGEPTRLRILALLRQQDLSVGELVAILAQSQPRLSHHLKALASAGLVERLPEGSFVFYRAASQDAPGRFLKNLFEQLDRTESAFRRDAEQLKLVTEERAQSAEAFFSSMASTWDTIRGLHTPNQDIESALLRLASRRRFQRVVDFGTGTGRMLALFASRAAEAEGIDLSHGMLTVARSHLQSAGLTNARVRQGDVTATPFDSQSCDLVIIHQVLHFMDAPGRAIAEAARLLMPDGMLLIVDFAPHELEFLRTEHGHHRLGLRPEAVRGWAQEAGLDIEAPLAIAPPEGAGKGLTVYIWKATKPAKARENAA